MPAGKHKSKSMRRVFIRTPGNRTVIHYRKRKPKQAKCSRCNAVLKGVSRARPYKMQNMPKTKKRPERPFGGTLCSKCARELLKEKARSAK